MTFGETRLLCTLKVLKSMAQGTTSKDLNHLSTILSYLNIFVMSHRATHTLVCPKPYHLLDGASVLYLYHLNDLALQRLKCAMTWWDAKQWKSWAKPTLCQPSLSSASLRNEEQKPRHFLKPDPENIQIRKQPHSFWSGVTMISISPPASPCTL